MSTQAGYSPVEKHLARELGSPAKQISDSDFPHVVTTRQLFTIGKNPKQNQVNFSQILCLSQ